MPGSGARTAQTQTARPKATKPTGERGVFNSRVVDPLVSLVTGSKPKAKPKPERAQPKPERAQPKPERAAPKPERAAPKPEKGQFNCRHCGRIYVTKGGLMKHLEDHHATTRR